MFVVFINFIYKDVVMKKIAMKKAETIVGGALRQICETNYQAEMVNDKSVCYQTTTCSDKFGLSDATVSVKRQVASSYCDTAAQ